MYRRRTFAALGTAAAALASLSAVTPPAALAAVSVAVFSNPAPISPPDDVDEGTTSQVVVAGQVGAVTDVDVTLNGLVSEFPDDLDLLLVGPNGKAVMLMNDDCDAQPILTPLSITFDDDAAVSAPPGDGCTAGPYFPAQNAAAVLKPAFHAPNARALSAFNGISPNGTWTLFAADHDAPDVSHVTGGFTLTFRLGDRTGPGGD
jgi:subtilisin-like proprotein convertase family protein